MRRIEAQDTESRQIAHSTLTWVANAKRLLTAAELQTALAIEPDTKFLDDDNILAIDIILSVCAGLVILDEQLSVVRLVHYTTQEYFYSIQSQQFPRAQTEITQSLLTFLAFNSTRTFFHGHYDISDYPPLFLYSQYCLAHAAGQPEGILKDMVIDFLVWIVRNSVWNTVWCVWGSSQPWGYSLLPQKLSVLWIAVAANLVQTAKFLLVAATHSQPLCQEIIVAAYYGYLQMVQLLVEYGAPMNGPHGLYRGPLNVASSEGHLILVEWLIKNGANVNAERSITGTVLQAASYYGHTSIAQLLIAHAANVNAEGGPHGNALSAASCAGHLDIVQLLIEHGADVNAHDRQYESALQAAASKGHKEVVQLLIEHGANVNLGIKSNALHEASSKGQESIVQLLLEHGANVNIWGGLYGNALQAASSCGHEVIVRFLIEHGAKVNMPGRYNRRALKAAYYYKNIVQVLIENGAKWSDEEEEVEAGRVYDL
jgi:ankyrin repeat protein